MPADRFSVGEGTAFVFPASSSQQGLSPADQLLPAYELGDAPLQQAELSPTCIHTEFERQAARTPTRVAVRTGELTLTYDELNRRAEVLARHFQALGIGPDGLVGVCVPRGPELVVAVLAALKAGGAYLPLDPAYPTARLVQMIEGSRVGVIVTMSGVSAQLPSGDARVVCLDAEAAPTESAASAGPEGADLHPAAARPENLAYVIYTSGSTGTPKGVMIEHRQVSNFFVGMDRVLGERDSTAPGVWLAGTSLSFDISVLELLWTLARGFTVVVQPEEDKAGTFAAAVTAHGVTHFQCTPSMASLLVAGEASRAALGALEVMLVGGEALSSGLACELLAAVRGDLLNMYGPTETTIWSTTWRVDREAFARDTAPRMSIGRPIANTTVHVLDELRAPAPNGVAGELYIGGAGLARGYLGRPDLTDERFIPSPFGPGRLYRTGDLGRTHGDGTIEFLGRVDHQVKIRGHRIELAEIELTLRELSSAREVVVMARQNEADPPGDQRLVAYMSGVTLTSAELRRRLRERLPEPMVPSAFVALEKLPLTPNGKIDRKALPAPEAVAERAGGGERGDRFIPPRTPTEHTIGAIWRELLRLPHVSVYDNFFDLGGHSLLSAQVVHHIEKRLNKRLHVAELVLQNLAQVSARCDQAADLETPGTRGVLGALKRLITKA